MQRPESHTMLRMVCGPLWNKKCRTVESEKGMIAFIITMLILVPPPAPEDIPVARSLAIIAERLSEIVDRLEVHTVTTTQTFTHHTYAFTPEPFAICDYMRDGDCDLLDYGVFQMCHGRTRPLWPEPWLCTQFDFDHDEDIDARDTAAWWLDHYRPNRWADSRCDCSCECRWMETPGGTSGNP